MYADSCFLCSFRFLVLIISIPPLREGRLGLGTAGKPASSGLRQRESRCLPDCAASGSWRGGRKTGIQKKRTEVVMRKGWSQRAAWSRISSGSRDWLWSSITWGRIFRYIPALCSIRLRKGSTTMIRRFPVC